MDARRTRGSAQRAAAAVVAALVLSLGGCGSDGNPWASHSEEYVAAFTEALGVGYTNAAPFLAPEVHHDLRAFVGREATGRADVVQMWRDHASLVPELDARALTPQEPPYVSRTGAVTAAAVDVGGLEPLHDAMALALSSEGIVDESDAVAVEDGHWFLPLTHQMQRLATTWVDAWAAADASAVATLYTEGAILEDSVAGVRAEGTAQIAAAADEDSARGGLPGATLRQVPEGTGPAVYLRGPIEPPAVEHLVVLVDVADPTGCDLAVAAVLSLDAEHRITRDERYRRVDTVRACAGDEPLPSGWWDHVEIPDPRAVLPTGSVSVAGVRVHLWNGTPEREHLLRWAFDRFLAAPIAPPGITSVTFVPFDGDPWSEWGFPVGALDTVAPSTAEGCAEQGCDPGPASARVDALTALAQVWLADPAQSHPIDEFALAHPGLADDFVDVATHVVVWGLMDEPYDAPPAIADMPCGDLTADFLTLTGTATDGGACTVAGRGA